MLRYGPYGTTSFLCLHILRYCMNEVTEYAHIRVYVKTYFENNKRFLRSKKIFITK